MFCYIVGVKGCKRKAAHHQHKDRKEKARTLLIVWKQIQEKGRTVIERKVVHLKIWREQLEKNVLERWENSPYDFGLAEGPQKTRVAVASISSPGVPSVGTPMKQRQADSPDLMEHSYLLDSQDHGDAVLAVEEAELDDASPGNEQPGVMVRANKSFFTWASEPFKPARVAKILRLIQIGDDVSSEERSSVWQLVEEFADIFALSVHEVKHILGAEHCLDIPKGAPLCTKIGQKPMTLPQVAYFLKALDIMVEAGVCVPIAAKDVKCVSPITLAEKAHAEKGMTMDELRQKINMECDKIGVPSPFIPPLNAQPLVVPDHEGVIQPEKWRVCTNYWELNKIMKVLPMPQAADTLWSLMDLYI